VQCDTYINVAAVIFVHCDVQHDSHQRESEYFAQQRAAGRICALVLGDKVSTLIHWTLSVSMYALYARTQRARIAIGNYSVQSSAVVLATCML
jgi:hypothetical protein